MLLGVSIVSELVASVLMSGNLSTDKPVSLMLIAAPESGKTSVIADPALEERVLCSDATGNGICDELMSHPKVHHIVISDMVSVMAHKEVTNKRTFGLLNGLTDEGLFKIALPGKAAYDFHGRCCGIICAIPLEVVGDGRSWWMRTGFSSRFLPFCYEYSKNLLLSIKEDVIVCGDYERNGKRPEPFKLPDKPQTVAIDTETMGRKIQVVADRAAKNLGEKGLRRGKQFRALARGHALYKKRKEVSEEDINFLMNLYPFMSYEIPNEL
jgi:hypothetical protein